MAAYRQEKVVIFMKWGIALFAASQTEFRVKFSNRLPFWGEMASDHDFLISLSLRCRHTW